MLKENLLFFREFFHEFEATGSCWPTSKWAAQALTRPIQKSEEPKRILELGPGTGPVTVHILSEMSEQDQLLLCEINPRLMKILKETVQKHPEYPQLKNQISFFEGPVQELPEDQKFDTIICALPFLNFSRSTVEEIFQKIQRVTVPEATMTYYEYIGMRHLGKLIPVAERHKRVKSVEQFFDNHFQQRKNHCEKVWKNFLPINVYTISPNARMNA